MAGARRWIKNQSDLLLCECPAGPLGWFGVDQCMAVVLVFGRCSDLDSGLVAKKLWGAV